MYPNRFWIPRAILCALAMLVTGNALAGLEHAHDDDDSLAIRAAAKQRIEWRAEHLPPGADSSSWLKVRVLSFNDFHGQISAGRRVSNRPVGGAAVLAAWLKDAQKDMESRTIIVHAGDHVGASPPESALLQDEPAIAFLNLLGDDQCRYRWRENPRCNLVGTPGNHEFDEGRDELMRLLYGGNHADGPFLDDPWRGTTFPYVSANVVNATTGKPILPPYIIKQVRGMRIAFIGAVLKDTPTIVTPSGVAGLKFLDEAEAVNRYIPELRREHVRAIVVLIHQGGRQTTYQGATQDPSSAITGDQILDIVSRLDDEVDVVVSGHAFLHERACAEPQRQPDPRHAGVFVQHRLRPD